MQTPYYRFFFSFFWMVAKKAGHEKTAPRWLKQAKISSFGLQLAFHNPQLKFFKIFQDYETPLYDWRNNENQE